MGLEKTPKTFNARFEKEVFWAIAELVAGKYGRDKTEAVSRAILEAKERLGESSPVWTIGGLTGKVSIPVVSDAPKAEEWPFHPRCEHCGENFGAFNRHARLCPECKRGRHIGEPRDCPACQERGTGAL